MASCASGTAFGKLRFFDSADLQPNRKHAAREWLPSSRQRHRSGKNTASRRKNRRHKNALVRTSANGVWTTQGPWLAGCHSIAGRRTSIKEFRVRTSNLVSAPPQPGARPTVIAPSRRKILLRGCCNPQNSTSRPHSGHRFFDFIKGNVDVIDRVRRRYRALLGGNRHEKHP